MSPQKTRNGRSKVRNANFESRSARKTRARPDTPVARSANGPRPILPFVSIALGAVCVLVAIDLLSRPVIGFETDSSRTPPPVSAGRVLEGPDRVSPPSEAPARELDRKDRIEDAAFTASEPEPSVESMLVDAYVPYPPAATELTNQVQPIVDGSVDLQRGSRVERVTPEAAALPAVASPGPDRSRSAPTFREPPPRARDLRIARSASDRRRVDRENAARGAAEFVRAGQIAFEDGNLEKALGLYQKAIARVPGHRRAAFASASVLVELGRLDQAIEIVREARRNTHDEAGLTMLHAQLVERSGDLGGAIKILDRAAQSPTEAPEVHALAAAYLQQAGEHELAIARYENLLRRYPGQPRWWMGLGISFEAAGRDDDAVDAYQVALQIGELPVKTRRWVGAQIETLTEEE